MFAHCVKLIVLPNWKVFTVKNILRSNVPWADFMGGGGKGVVKPPLNCS